MLLYLMLSMIRQHNVLHILFFVFVCISNFGYTFLALSKTLEEALLANKILYICSFLPFIMILSNAQFCRVRVPGWAITVLAALNVVQLFFINTIGYSSLYYEDVSIGDYNGVTYLIKSYGPGHTFYIILLFVETFLAFIVIIYSLRRKKNTTYNTILFLGIGMLFTVVLYIVERRIRLEIDLLPLAYVINAMVYLIVSYRTQLYGISSGIISIYEKRKNYVCISLDSNFKLMDYNDNSVELFPEIAEVHLDSDNYPKDSVFYRTIIVWVKDIASKEREEQERIIPIGEYIYRATVRLRNAKSGRFTGYVVEMLSLIHI